MVRAALDLGIRDFDTANIYGQGDSERFLGAALRGFQDVRIITKAGQTFPLAKRVIVPFKRILRPIVARRPNMSAVVSNARAADLPRDWSPTHLRTSLEKSLRRLGRSHVDIFLLHSPGAEVLRQGDAMTALTDFKQEGKTLTVGASIDDMDALEAALDDPRVEAVQFPLHPGSAPDPVLLSAAKARGVRLIAREILGGATSREGIDDALRFAARQPVDLALLGTTKPERLRAAQQVMRATSVL